MLKYKKTVQEDGTVISEFTINKESAVTILVGLIKALHEAGII